jgi:hypothetical protein
MARTSKKAKPVPVETVEAVADTEIRSADNIAAKIVAAVPETGAEGLVTGEATAPVAPIVNGATIYVPLNRLKRHPENARKTLHSAASIEHKAASIAVKGILQNLIVEPELDGDGNHTGDWLVAIGEGRRQAQLLRAGRGEIADTELIRCVVDIETILPKSALTKTSTARTCTPPTSSRSSVSFPRFADGDLRKSRPGSGSPRMWCVSAFAFPPSAPGWCRCTAKAG